MPKAKEVIVKSKFGGSKGRKLAEFSYIPAMALKAVAARFGYGADKYGDADDGPGNANWVQGNPMSSYISALERHLYSFKAGEDIDGEVIEYFEERGYSREEMSGVEFHLAAVAWHALVLLHMNMNPQIYGEMDDRLKTLESGR